jgi:mevalonate kinase
MDIISSAPNKVIITGEHSVVHGSYAIAVPISLRNKVHLVVKDATGAEPHFYLEALNGWNVKVYAGGNVEGTASQQLSGFVSLFHNILKQNEASLFRLDKIFEAKIISSNSPKGTGNSASIAAALAMALHAYFNQKPEHDELFEETHNAEKIVYPTDSGIDSRTVTSNKAQKLRKVFAEDGSSKFEFNEVVLNLPAGTSLLVIDTLLPGQKIISTAELVKQFSQTYFKKNPTELSFEEKNKIVDMFNPVVKEIEQELSPSGNPAKLGKLFLKNHELLRKGGVVPKEMDEVIDLCMKNGCYGAKGTGACGPGGAIIALVDSKKMEKVKTALHAFGLKNVFEAQIADIGPVVESVIIDEKDEKKEEKK